MKFTIQNNILIKQLQKINRLLIKNTSSPILENILIKIENKTLFLIVTNLDIELVVKIKISSKHVPGSITISGRKLLNICRNSSELSEIKIQLKLNKIHIFSQNSSYILNTLPAENFPNNQNFSFFSEFSISSNSLKNMIEKIQFSMGKQDVRYYLNGMLLEKKDTSIYAVATDGYRLSITQTCLEKDIPPFSIIIPRKSIIELHRLLNINTKLIRVLIGKNNIKIYIEDLIFTTQLIEGEYPDYKSVLFEKQNKPIIFNLNLLKKSLLRAAILSHEKFCGVEIHIRSNQFKVSSDNQEEEIAEDTFNIDYSGNSVKISINVYYMLDILNTINSENIFLFLNHENNSIQIESENDESTLYIVMLLKR